MSLRLKTWKQVVHDKDHGWSPFFSLVYLVFYLVQPIYDHPSARVWALDMAGLVVFLCLYLGLFFLEKPRVVLHLGGMLLLGMVFMPFNGAACTFFIYAAAIAPFATKTQRAAISWLISISAIGAIEGLLLKLNGIALFFIAVFPLFIGGGNIFLPSVTG